jgi:integrase
MEPEISTPKKQPRKPKWPKIREHIVGEYKYWIVDRGLVNGKRKRETFKTKGEADTRADELRAQRENEGKSADLIPQDLRFEAAACVTKLSPYGVTLTAAVDHYLSHVIPYRDAPIISAMVEEMITEKRGMNLESRTIGDLQHKLRRFSRSFGDRKLTDIKIQELQTYILDPVLEPQTIIGYSSKVSELFNWAIKKGYAEANLMERISLPQKDDKPPGILTVKQCEDLLKHASEFNLMPYVTLGLFAGIRSAELLRLEWEAVKVSQKVVIIGAKVAKMRSRRVVQMNKALLRWLLPHVERSGMVVDLTEDEFDAQFTKLREKAKIKTWPDNGLRHSFASYHLAHHKKPHQTAYLMGHKKPDLLDNHYKELVLPAEARRFWALKPKVGPSSGAKIIAFNKAA